jgi:anthranilate/para-aminobenzoate synthase component II
MKNSKITLGLITLVVATSATTFAQADEFNSHEGSRWGQFQQQGQARHAFKQNVDKSIEKISNGVIIMLTTTDTDTLEKLQSREPRNRNEDLSVIKENLANGIKITKTTTDAELLKKLHAKADRMLAKQSITKTVENISNGVIITRISTDSEIVTKMQEKELKEPRNQDITHTKENITNGVKITITTDNEDLIERIQARAEQGGHHGKRRGHRQGRFGKQRQFQQGEGNQEFGFGRQGRGGFRGFGNFQN